MQYGGFGQTGQRMLVRDQYAEGGKNADEVKVVQAVHGRGMIFACRVRGGRSSKIPAVLKNGTN
jgi:hypothetical protein